MSQIPEQAGDSVAPDANIPAPAPSWIARLLAHPATPLAVGLAIVLAAVAFALPRLPFGGGTQIVVFDPVKFINAQRAAASILAMSPSADMTLTLTQVARQSEAVIKEEARGAIVLVKQSVVVPDGLVDITDAVLTRFGLPTEVPTVTTEPGKALEFVAPSDSAFSPGKAREDLKVELEELTSRRAADKVESNAQRDMIP